MMFSDLLIGPLAADVNANQGAIYIAVYLFVRVLADVSVLPSCLPNVPVAVSQDRVKRVENCVNTQAKVPTDPTVKSFGLSIKGTMMEVNSSCSYVMVHYTGSGPTRHKAFPVAPLSKHLMGMQHPCGSNQIQVVTVVSHSAAVRSSICY